MNGSKSRLEKADERIGELADTPEEEIIQNAKQGKKNEEYDREVEPQKRK